jgi:threonine synthase
MRFASDAGPEIGLVEAAALGRPEGGRGPFFPTGEDDFRSAIYAPELSYSDFAASAISALFPGDIDPMLALRLAERAFPSAPEAFALDEELTVVDLSAGASASSADPGAAFLGGLLASAAKAGGPRLVLADGSGPEGAALSEALDGIEGLSLALLYPEGSRAAGVRPPRLEREGGSARLIAVRGGPERVRALLSSSAGRRFGGRVVTLAGPSNPARLAARIIGCAAVFAAQRKGATGELYIGLRAGDGIGLAACLWAWRLGIPLTGAILNGGGGADPAAGQEEALGPDPDGRALASRFEDERPGVIRSLVRLPAVDPGKAFAARAELDSAGGPPVDLGTSAAIAAAAEVLDQGLRGHARILVLSERHPVWSEEGTRPPRALSGAMFDARPDAEIGPSLAELEAALSR